ncbi:MAG: hypothetical protein GXO31_05460 [Epsilonproteobacteria bacterium]|nr:hypothetical protein [Campylobacterota bacterium]
MIIKKLSLIVSGSLLAASMLSAGNYPYHQKVQSYSYGLNANAAGYINQIVGTIADQLGQNKDFKNIKDTPIAVASIVNLENYKQTDKLGNVIEENLIHEMQVRGFKVVDYKTMPTIKVGAKGDYAFSRLLYELKKEQHINYVLAGTYTKYRGGIAINCRLIDLKTNVVVSSAQTYIPAQLVSAVDYKNGFDVYPSGGVTKVKVVKVIPKVQENTVMLESY